jgi:hypothetical protein
MKNEENKNDKVNEPSAAYGTSAAFPYHTIRAASFEELENQNRLYSFSLTPLQRLVYLHELNINAFGKSTLEIKEFERKIHPSA